MNSPLDDPALAQHGDATAAPLRVLLLEDSRLDAELVQEALLQEFPHARPTLVRDASGFEVALRDGPWSLVLSDFQLPSFSGAEALRLTRARFPELPFIFVSGVIGEDNAVELLKAGATDYVSKARLQRLGPVARRALRESGERQARADAERRLRAADAAFSRVVEGLHDYAVILLDARGRVGSWNHGAAQMFGYAAEEAGGQRLDTLLAEELAGIDFAQEMRRACDEGRATREGWARRKDGRAAWIECLLTPLFDDDGVSLRGFCKIARDCTAQHEAAERLRQAKEEAERANLAKDRFLAVLSHELRNPLAAISFAAQLLAKVATVPEKFRDLVPTIRRSVAMEARLVDDLLDLSAISNGKLGLRPTEIEANAVVRDVADMVAESLAQRQLRLDLALSDEPAPLRGDPARIKQVVANLLRNAIKFSEPGGCITVRTRIEGESFVLECADEGIGIPPEALERIFSAFEQADRDVAKRFGGLGLGLTISRHLVTEHGGQLLAASEGPGRGATFTVVLPLLSVEQRPVLRAPGAAPPTEPRGERAGRAARVLLVEDNADAAQIMAMAMEGYGYRVRHAGSVAEALRAAGEGEFDVVITDLGLPDGSGIEVGEALGAHLPVIALSGYGAAADVQRTTRAGFSGHLVKPADPDEIHEMVQRVLPGADAGPAPADGRA